MTRSDAPSRHDLVWLDPVQWPAALRAALSAEDLDLISAWLAAGHPAVVRRAALAPEVVGVGIPLSPARGRRRLAFAVTRVAIRLRRAPLALAEIMASAPPAWQSPLAQLDARARALGLSLRVYGSLLWQHLTREEYVTARSDIDLLFSVRSRAQLEGALALFTAWEAETGRRLDGELLIADDRAVAWRELLHAPTRVLVKDATTASLHPFSAVLATLDPDPL
jgi:phosphoribosyl-dephospho-CoA transferase